MMCLEQREVVIFWNQMECFAYDPDTDKYYFCGMEERNTFFDRCQRSMECGRNLFTEEWREWEGYEEGCLY